MFVEVDVGDKTAAVNDREERPSFVGVALLQSGCWHEAQGIIATTLAAQLTAEQGSKSCGDDKTSACRKTIHSDSSKEAPLIFQLQAGRRSTWLCGLEKKY